MVGGSTLLSIDYKSICKYYRQLHDYWHEESIELRQQIPGIIPNNLIKIKASATFKLKLLSTVQNTQLRMIRERLP